MVCRCKHRWPQAAISTRAKTLGEIREQHKSSNFPLTESLCLLSSLSKQTFCVSFTFRTMNYITNKIIIIRFYFAGNVWCGYGIFPSSDDWASTAELWKHTFARRPPHRWRTLLLFFSFIHFSSFFFFLYIYIFLLVYYSPTVLIWKLFILTKCLICIFINFITVMLSRLFFFFHTFSLRFFLILFCITYLFS